MKNEEYLFLDSTNKDLIEKTKKRFPAGDIGIVNHSRFYYKSKVGNPAYFSIINNTKDYDLEDISTLSRNEYESMISIADFSKGVIWAATDYWGIQNHYYFFTAETFIISNNIFLIKSVLRNSTRFNKEALFEFLFFGAPLNEKTWFAGINCLLPGQRLEYSIKTGQLHLSAPTDFATDFSKPAMSLLDAAERYYRNVKNVINDTPVYLALSSGSDSQSILAALRYFEFNFQCVCWGKDNYSEKDRVKTLASKLNFPLEFIPLTEFEDNHNDFLMEGMKKTNGLINPMRTHYVEYYSKLKYLGNYFEGILGSEFVKGEISCPTMTSLLMKEVIADKKSIDRVIEKYYKGIHPDFINQLKQYIKDKYSSLLIDINTKRGQEVYSDFAFKFIPAKVFSGLILLVKDKMNVYFPYLNPSLLNAIFHCGFGIKNFTSMGNFFPSALKSILPESLLVQKFDQKLFNIELDRGISFKDSLRKPLIVRTVRLMTKIRNKLTYDNSKFGGQIDNSVISKRVVTFAKKIQEPILPIEHWQDNFYVAKAILNYDYLERC